MSRLDHIAYRTKDKDKTAKFFQQFFGYKIADSFPIVFEDGSQAQCIALEPQEKNYSSLHCFGVNGTEYHLAPEIFVSDGDNDSIVGKWVVENGGGIHHKAYQFNNEISLRMQKSLMESYDIKFASDVIYCQEEDLWQVFTKPLDMLGGIILELIVRGPNNPGFCKASVKTLMESINDN